MSRHWTRYVDAEAKSDRRKRYFFSRGPLRYVPGTKWKRRKLRSRAAKCERAALTRRERHDTKRALRL